MGCPGACDRCCQIAVTRLGGRAVGWPPGGYPVAARPARDGRTGSRRWAASLAAGQRLWVVPLQEREEAFPDFALQRFDGVTIDSRHHGDQLHRWADGVLHMQVALLPVPVRGAPEQPAHSARKASSRESSEALLATVISTIPLTWAPLCVQFWNGVVVK